MENLEESAEYPTFCREFIPLQAVPDENSQKAADTEFRQWADRLLGQELRLSFRRFHVLYSFGRWNVETAPDLQDIEMKYPTIPGQQAGLSALSC